MAATLILTPKLRIEPFSPIHLSDDYIAWLNDKVLMRHSEQQFCDHDRKSCCVYAKSFDHHSSFLWAIRTASDQRHVGNINAYCVHRHQLADIGILIGAPDLQGQGIGYEAWSAVMQFLFRKAGSRKVTGGCVDNNRAMLRIMERAGMVDDGTRSHHLIYEGKALDVVYKAQLKTQFTADEKVGLFPAAVPDWTEED